MKAPALVEDDTKDLIITGSFIIKKPLPNNGEITIQGHLYDKDTAAKINVRLDELQDVAHRQHLRASLEFLDAQRKQHVAHLEQVRARYAELVDSVKGGRKLKTQQQPEYQHGQQTIDNCLKEIGKIEGLIAETKAKVDGHAKAA